MTVARSTLPRRELLTAVVIGDKIHVRYRTARHSLCGLPAPAHEPNHFIPDCGLCSKTARAFDRIDCSMPDHWKDAA